MATHSGDTSDPVLEREPCNSYAAASTTTQTQLEQFIKIADKWEFPIYIGPFKILNFKFKLTVYQANREAVLDPAIIQTPALILDLPVAVKPTILIKQSYPIKKYQRYYLDFSQSYNEYQKKFSSKSRSTFKRKLKKYLAFNNNNCDWRCYDDLEQITEFYQLACEISKKSYQTLRHNSGIASENWTDIEKLAKQKLIRGYILFVNNQPVSYLYFTVLNDTLIYHHLGYDPTYAAYSVGTVLHQLAIEDLFKQNKFKFLDFTEGEGEHKRFYSTTSINCAHVLLHADMAKFKIYLILVKITGWINLKVLKKILNNKMGIKLKHKFKLGLRG